VTSTEFTITVSVYGLYHKSLNKSFIKNIKQTLNIKNDKSNVKPSYTGVFRNHHINNNDYCALAINNANPKTTLTKSISIISNTFSLKKTKKDQPQKNPMDNIDLVGKEIFIGDYEINFTTQKLDKTTGTYTLRQQQLVINKQNNNSCKKHPQSIIIQTGIYWDEKVKQTISVSILIISND